MKRLLTISSLFICLLSHAQIIDRFVVSASGASAQSGGYRIDMTLGETVGSYYRSPAWIVTPGFQQGPVYKRTTSISLAGSIIDNKVALVWSMPFENNSVRFFIQKQQDTSNVYQEIDSLPTRATGGSTLVPVAYTFTDDHPAALNRYRIRLRLRDGSDLYSNGIQIAYSGAAWRITATYPNPVQTFCIIRVFSTKAMPARYIVCDAEGKIIYTASHRFEKGLSELTLPVSTLPAGTYFFQLQSMGDPAPAIATRFVKIQ